MRKANALTENLIKKLEPNVRAYKVFDGGGLYIEVPARGQKRWRFKYRFERKEQLISFGTYPHVTIEMARKRRDNCKRYLSCGINPSVWRRKMIDEYGMSIDDFHCEPKQIVPIRNSYTPPPRANLIIVREHLQNALLTMPNSECIHHISKAIKEIDR